MRYKIIILITLLLIFTIGSMAQTSKQEDELRDIYKKIDVALKACNVEKVTQYYDQNYTLESDGKKMNRDEVIEQWRSILGFIKSVDKLETKIDKITVKDGLYTVDYSQKSRGKIQFPASPVLPFDYTGKISDSWKCDARGVWKTISSVEHISDLKVNGESAKPPSN